VTGPNWTRTRSRPGHKNPIKGSMDI
jgi:hypothetical protein